MLFFLPYPLALAPAPVGAGPAGNRSIGLNLLGILIGVKLIEYAR